MRHILSRIGNYHSTYILGFACTLTLNLLHFYSGGSIILGGEGNYILNYPLHFENTAHQWHSRFGLGGVNLVPGSNTTNLLFLSLIENFFQNAALSNFVLIFFMYFLPFLGMYLIPLELKQKPYLCATIALFYAINPFSTQFLSTHNQWNAFALSVIPILFWVVLRYYNDNLKLFLWYGSISAFFSFAYTNHPLCIIINISTILAVYITSYYRHGRLLPAEFLKKYFLVFSAFLTLNTWWLLNLFRTAAPALELYSASSAMAWLKLTVAHEGNPLAKIFSITSMVPPKTESFAGHYFNTPISFFIGMIPIFLTVIGLFLNKNTRMVRLNIHILVMVLLAILLTKGAAPPFGSIYLFLFEYVPFFNVLKSPIEKFGILQIFLLSILLLFTLLAGKNSKYYKKWVIIFTAYLLFCAGPLLTGNIIAGEMVLGSEITVTRKFKEKPLHKNFRTQINNEKLEYKILSLPGMGNYQMLFDSLPGKQYSGLDPLLHNTNKGFLTNYLDTEIKTLYNFMLDEKIQNLFGTFNIGKLVINGNLKPWFGWVGPAGSQKLRNRFKDLPRKDFGNISAHSILNDFIPVVNVPQTMMLNYNINRRAQDR